MVNVLSQPQRLHDRGARQAGLQDRQGQKSAPYGRSVQEQHPV